MKLIIRTLKYQIIGRPQGVQSHSKNEKFESWANLSAGASLSLDQYWSDDSSFESRGEVEWGRPYPQLWAFCDFGPNFGSPESWILSTPHFWGLFYSICSILVPFAGIYFLCRYLGLGGGQIFTLLYALNTKHVRGAHAGKPTPRHRRTADHLCKIFGSYDSSNSLRF